MYDMGQTSAGEIQELLSNREPLVVVSWTPD